MAQGSKNHTVSNDNSNSNLHRNNSKSNDRISNAATNSLDNTEKQLEDIIEVDENTLSLAELEFIANDKKVHNCYKEKYKSHLYSNILMSLTHESFPENEAKALWYEIIDHMQKLNHTLGRYVGVSVASLDYLTNIKCTLIEPKIIEEDKINYVAQATTKDELTGLYLREVFNVVLKKELGEARRSNSMLCLLMIDIDDFKNVNDTYGHQKGDEVLSKIGDTINDSVREMDLAARYGGEELAIIMPNTTMKDAYQVGDRIRKKIENLTFCSFNVTVSIGLGAISKTANTTTKLIDIADMALYKAKENGKNQVVMGDE
ncbi:GGDEF domain-containing protein [Endozoicomonas sp. SM1973]|uniref:diguanylate cyclase n=1 Tax=Spartinivicinus marinus TaxID=2994442 RepID=A0A853IBL2_9GAMM|nr:GGDEF domain-containing protein [Spartinivicinus marinus]NYZ67251.1 GGDEF domain-containing protein [Spartinivicinus marinus]